MSTHCLCGHPVLGHLLSGVWVAVGDGTSGRDRLIPVLCMPDGVFWNSWSFGLHSGTPASASLWSTSESEAPACAYRSAISVVSKGSVSTRRGLARESIESHHGQVTAFSGCVILPCTQRAMVVSVLCAAAPESFGLLVAPA